MDYLDRLEKVQPEVYHAQHQQSPILHTGEGAKVYSVRPGQAPALLRQADAAGHPPRGHRRGPPHGLAGHHRWDHGVDARREICVVLLWHPSLQEMWVVGVLRQHREDDPEDDAKGCASSSTARHPDPGGHREPGDVGSLGKNAADNVARDINTALYWARDKAGLPILGFPIATVKKGPGSVENGTNVLNVAFAGVHCS